MSSAIGANLGTKGSIEIVLDEPPPIALVALSILIIASTVLEVLPDAGVQFGDQFTSAISVYAIPLITFLTVLCGSIEVFAHNIHSCAILSDIQVESSRATLTNILVPSLAVEVTQNALPFG